jgi:hypothetical protein
MLSTFSPRSCGRSDIQGRKERRSLTLLIPLIQHYKRSTGAFLGAARPHGGSRSRRTLSRNGSGCWPVRSKSRLTERALRFAQRRPGCRLAAIIQGAAGRDFAADRVRKRVSPPVVAVPAKSRRRNVSFEALGRYCAKRLPPTVSAGRFGAGEQCRSRCCESPRCTPPRHSEVDRQQRQSHSLSG